MAVFQHLKDQVWTRLQSWKCRNLSQVGHMVLLQSVIQAMPTIVMSCFLLPISICQEIEGMMVDFLCHTKDNRRIHWLAWDKLCVGKEEGGLGFRKLHLFNQALLAKKLWQVIESHTVYLGAYLFASGLIIGFLGHYLSCSHCAAKYWVAHHGLADWSFIWAARVPPKVRLFAQRVCRKGFPTVTNLEERGVVMNAGCPWCGCERDEILHVLIRCLFSRLVWALSNIRWACVARVVMIQRNG
ncbi:UNVERIFIED_CONTAM: putative mitochondrial protein [Sesamum latifolium]|uniref:Mitochondrial protein n=1 Tax=Sesamum latifolium TaxID=2727402 RepID=A0AAW2UH91_9LAMI